MTRSSIFGLTALAVSLVLCGPATAQKKEAAKEWNYGSIADALDTPVDTKPLRNEGKVKFKVFLEFMADKLGGNVSIIVDREAFAAVLGADAADLYEEEIQIPLGKMRASRLLSFALSQVAKGEATYLIRNSIIEITPYLNASPESLLGYPIRARFDKKPFADAVDILCEQSGATILIDPRVGDKARTPVTAEFRNPIALEGVMRLLAEMADLQVETRENILFITSKPKLEGPQQKGALEFKDRRIDLAVKDLAAWSGQTVLLDPAFMPPPTQPATSFGGPRRAARLEKAASACQMGGLSVSLAEQLKSMKVTASFKPNVPARVIAEVIARQTGLAVLERENLIYFTGPQ